MTTIAYKDGVMAADSGLLIGETHFGRVRKLFRLKTGAVVGVAGRVAQAHSLIQWLEDGSHPEDRPPVGNISALIVYPTGRMVKWEGEGFIEIRGERHYALGSGEIVALGALDAGATARRAVQIATKRDANSRGPVRTMRLLKLAK